MKKQVKLSTWSTMLSAVAIIFLLYLMVQYYNKAVPSIWVTIAVCLIAWMALALFYMPLSITVDNENVTVNRSIWFKKIPLDDITDIKLCPPTMGERLIIGSSGFMGYWGWFSEKDTGRYFAYYGKSSDCFLVTLRNGKKYMLGCDDAPEMVSVIKSGICTI